VSRPPLSAVLVLIAAICILAVIAVASAIPPNDETNPSSRSAGTLGTLALYIKRFRFGFLQTLHKDEETRYKQPMCKPAIGM
jgi:hypothetical protein